MLRSFLVALCIYSVACVDHSVTDPRTFHCAVLDNGMTLLVVEDPKATESAAAMYVDVGSNENPEGREGLAHFLEHMLFITTKEYPEVDSLSEYVSSHGGSYNAFTGDNRTQYYFSVKPEYFKEGLNIFTSFFIEPLFDEEYVDRERHAVHSEFIVNRESDGWRHFQVFKTILSEHPANRFRVGNLDTLQMEGLRDDLVTFYESHYSADQMYFTAVVPSGAEQVMSEMQERLSLVEKRETIAKDLTPRIAKEDLGQVLYYKPVSDIDELNIDFVLPNGKKQYLKPSSRYIIHLLGDEGVGSIIHALREADLATELSAGINQFSEEEDLLDIEIKLTKKGVAEKDKVISTVMSYINLMRAEGVSQYRFNEMQRVSFLQYLYYSQQDVLAQVNQLVGNMKDYPSKKWYNVGYVLQDSEFDPSHIQLLLDRLNLDNAIVGIVSPSVETDRVEPFYEADYAVSKISEAQMEAWNQTSEFELALPNKNAFIPDNIDMVDVEDTSTPLQISEETWYKRGEFSQPKQFIGYGRVLPVESPTDAVQLMLLVRLLEHEKMASLYPAITAGGAINVSMDEQGITINVGGLGDKQDMVLSQAIKSLYNLEKVTELEFEQAKQEIMTDLKNMEDSVAIYLLLEQLTVEMMSSQYHYSVLLDQLEKTSLTQFKKSLRAFLSQSKSQRFYYGNMDPDNVKRLTDKIEVEYKPIVLKKGNKIVDVDSTRSDNAVVLYYQMDDNSDEDQLMAAMIAKMIQTPMFKQLRTEEQMGYIVAARYREINRWPGMIFGVQSPNIATKDIRARIEKFLADQEFWDEEAFETVKASMILDLEKPFKTMGEEFGFYWSQIHSGQFDYDQKARLRSVLAGITYNDVKDYYENIMQNPRQLTLMTK